MNPICGALPSTALAFVVYRCDAWLSRGFVARFGKILPLSSISFSP
jgi:hypothetical protein